MDWMFKVVPWFIGFVFVVIVASWIGYGVIAYKAIQLGPEGIGNLAGQVIKGVKEGSR